MLENILYSLGFGCSVFAIVGYGLSRILKRNDIADVLWGVGFVLVSGLSFFKLEEIGFKSILLMTFVCLWGFRLAFYIGYRHFNSQQEDIRYLNWRKDWGSKEPIFAFLKVFVLQSFFLAIIGFVVVFAMSSKSDLLAINIFGAALFAVGFIFEAVSDYELFVFKKQKNKTSKVMNQGLWYFSRHPNYFGEILVWWGIWFFCFQNNLVFLITLISPLTITWLLTKVSGVPMLEKSLQEKGSEFVDYVKTTPALAPFIKKHILQFFKLILVMLFLDFVWLGLIMNSFYQARLDSLIRLSGDGSWNINFVSAIGVYICLAIALQFFVLRNVKTRAEALFQAAILGLFTYGVYDLTNHALLAGWSTEVVIIDILWGAILMGLSAIVVFKDE